MQNGLLENWGEKEAALMERGILLARHRLLESGLFSDEGLLRVLDTHPREDLNTYTMGRDLLAQEWRRGDDAGLSGEKLLEAARRGRIWLNIRRMTWHHGDYAELLSRLYAELERACPGFAPFQLSANLLISSPSALVFYHADAPLNMLWHLRGRKRCWVYPLENPRFASQKTLETVYVPGEVGEELPYELGFDAEAQVYDLEPGQLITWPQNTPHRIENLSELNVSLSTEHYTPEARRRQAVFLANHYFRRWLPFPFASTELFGPGPCLKANSFRVIRRLGLVPTAENNLPVTFEVDLEAEHCVRWLSPEDAPKDMVPQAA